MSLNLHAEVRGAITTVNPDQSITWRENTGSTQAADYSRTPTFVDHTLIAAQVQALSAGQLRHSEFLNIQGVKRSVYMYGNKQGVVRIDAKGGDILQFPQVLGGTVRNWLVYDVIETWNPDGVGWCHVAVVLQDT